MNWTNFFICVLWPLFALFFLMTWTSFKMKAQGKVEDYKTPAWAFVTSTLVCLTVVCFAALVGIYTAN